MRGKVEFLRINTDGTQDKRVFSYNPNAEPGSYKNPILANNDVVRIRSSILNESVEVLNSVTGPAVGIWSIYSLFRP